MSGTKKALREVLAMLDGWIEVGQENHKAMEHRDTDCCTTLHPEDVRTMVEDVGRQIKAKKRRKKGRADAPRKATVILTLEQIATGIYSTHVVTPGDTLQVTVNGYIQTGGKRLAVVEFPVRIRAHIA